MYKWQFEEIGDKDLEEEYLCVYVMWHISLQGIELLPRQNMFPVKWFNFAHLKVLADKLVAVLADQFISCINSTSCRCLHLIITRANISCCRDNIMLIFLYGYCSFSDNFYNRPKFSRYLLLLEFQVVSIDSKLGRRNFKFLYNTSIIAYEREKILFIRPVVWSFKQIWRL